MWPAFTLHTLVGNIGGYIGLFLGYAITMIPQSLRGLGTRIRDWIAKKKQNTMVDQTQNERDENPN